jgi:hypothetical protein
MATEERILAKMEQIKKQREDAAIEKEALRRLAAIEKEALRRLAAIEEESAKKAAEKAESERREKAAANAERRAKLNAEKAIAAEKKNAIRDAVKMAYNTYTSNNIQSTTCSPSMFKKYQQQLINMGITIEHLADPYINRVRIPSQLIHAGGSTKEMVVDISYILTVSAPLRETNSNYALYGTLSPHGSGAHKPRWID